MRQAGGTDCFCGSVYVYPVSTSFCRTTLKRSKKLPVHQQQLPACLTDRLTIIR